MTTFPRGVYAILDTDRLGWPDADTLARHLVTLAAYAQAAIDHGAVAIQLRAKGIPLGHAVRAEAVGLLCDLGGPVPILVNDDVAVAAGRGGLHLGQGDGDVQAARRMLGPDRLLGLSTHTLAQVLAAAGLPVDYLGFGPIRATTGKRDHDATTGLDGLRQAVAVAAHPLVAIGGLELADLAPVRDAGAHAAAVIGAWLGPVGATRTPHDAGLALGRLVGAWRR
jgi:thiamine-phosphate pyrophosphorylase